MVAILGFSKEQIRQAVTDMYTRVANAPRAGYHFPVGVAGCRATGYPQALLDGLPEASVESFAGVGCPHLADVIRTGDTVLDIGAGSGTDALIAARLVGSKGRVFALDSTAAMREKLGGILARERIDNVEPLAGDAESIPLPDASVDVVTSNGVLNLVPDKRRAVDEIFRVLKPGGHVQIADIVIHVPVTPDCKDAPALWAECVVGASIDALYLELFRDAGFENVELLRKDDYFAHSPSTETREVAARFGGHAIVLRMRRADSPPPRIVRLARRLDPRRMAAGIRRRGVAGLLAVAVALFACYGTLALAVLLPILGFGFTLDDGAWAGAIVATSLLAALVVAAGWKKHGSARPAMLAVPGAVAITYTMLVDYQAAVEAGGFALLVAGALLDYRYRRSTVAPRPDTAA